MQHELAAAAMFPERPIEATEALVGKAGLLAAVGAVNKGSSASQKFLQDVLSA